MGEPHEVDDDLLEHMMLNQVLPQAYMRAANEAGIPGHTTFVDTTPGAVEGYPIVCSICGRTARSPFAAPVGATVVCPRCIRGVS